jgi:L-aminopeptidase/D-esterase-like protein
MFALATGGSTRTLPLTVLGALAAEVTQRAVLNGVRAASGVREPPLPSAQDIGWA